MLRYVHNARVVYPSNIKFPRRLYSGRYMQIERMGKAIPYVSAVHKSIYEHRVEKRQTQIPYLRYSRLFLLFRYILSVYHI